MKKVIGIHTGNVSYGGQEKMLIEFLKVLNPGKYCVKLYIEENKKEKNIYEGEIPEYVEYEFLNEVSIMEKIDEYKKSKNPLKKILRSYLLKKKKKVAIEKLNEKIENIDILIDYDMGLIRNIHRLKLNEKRVIGWSHAGSGEVLKNNQKRKNTFLYGEIVAINGPMERGFLKNYPGIKVHKIYNFVDEEKIFKLSEKNISENIGKYILSVGSLTRNKRHGELIKTFKEYIEENTNDINLVIIGEGEERDNLEELIKTLDLENRVFLLGNRENPYKYMKKCEIYIQPSLNEAFPLVLMESMTLGRPVISFKNNGGREILEEGKYGILYEKNEELKNSIKTLLGNSEEREKFVKLSLERAYDFSRKSAMEGIERLLENGKNK